MWNTTRFAETKLGRTRGKEFNHSYFSLTLTKFFCHDVYQKDQPKIKNMGSVPFGNLWNDIGTHNRLLLPMQLYKNKINISLELKKLFKRNNKNFKNQNLQFNWQFWRTIYWTANFESDAAFCVQGFQYEFNSRHFRVEFSSGSWGTKSILEPIFGFSSTPW